MKTNKIEAKITQGMLKIGELLTERHNSTYKPETILCPLHCRRDLGPGRDSAKATIAEIEKETLDLCPPNRKVKIVFVDGHLIPNNEHDDLYRFVIHVL
jgi:hypothetical protein